MQEAVCVTTLVVEPMCGNCITELISKISACFEVSEFRLQMLEIGSLGATHTFYHLWTYPGLITEHGFVFNPLMVHGWGLGFLLQKMFWNQEGREMCGISLASLSKFS